MYIRVSFRRVFVVCFLCVGAHLRVCTHTHTETYFLYIFTCTHTRTYRHVHTCTRSISLTKTHAHAHTHTLVCTNTKSVRIKRATTQYDNSNLKFESNPAFTTKRRVRCPNLWHWWWQQELHLVSKTYTISAVKKRCGNHSPHFTPLFDLVRIYSYIAGLFRW